MIRSFLFILVLFAGFMPAAAQEAIPASLVPYVHGMRIKGALLLNVMGYDVIVERVAGNFSRPHVRRLFPTFRLHQEDAVLHDSSLGRPALRIDKTVVSRSDTEGHQVFYFFQQHPDSITGISVTGARAPVGPWVRSLVRLLSEEGIPDSLLTEPTARVLPFAGRSIPVDPRCRWNGTAILQCPGFGELNWSLHPNEQDAASRTAWQEARNSRTKVFKLEAEESVPILFEGAPVTARRLRYRVKGITGALTKAEGSNILIVYYVTAPVRGRFVSCVLSHWTSDYLKPGGLPPLLDEVMQLQ